MSSHRWIDPCAFRPHMQQRAGCSGRFGAVAIMTWTVMSVITFAHADDRRFTFLDENRHHPPAGGWEFEQGVLWDSSTKEDGNFNRVDFKHEIEYGLSERIQVAIDVAEWHWQHDDEGSETKYDLSAAEIKFTFLDPVTDVIGVGFKFELGIGPKSLELENVFILDKVIDRWEFCYNFVLEPDWEGEDYFEYDEDGVELVNRFGISYELTPSLYIGGELVHEIPLPDWKSGEKQNLFLGPNFSFRGNNWAVTSTVQFLLTGGDDEPKFRLNTIFEIDF